MPYFKTLLLFLTTILVINPLLASERFDNLYINNHYLSPFKQYTGISDSDPARDRLSALYVTNFSNDKVSQIINGKKVQDIETGWKSSRAIIVMDMRGRDLSCFLENLHKQYKNSAFFDIGIVTDSE